MPPCSRAAAQAMAQAPGAKNAGVIRNGELEIQPAKRQVRYRGETIDFTALEFDLLLHFASHPGHVLLARAAARCGLGLHPRRL